MQRFPYWPACFNSKYSPMPFGLRSPNVHYSFKTKGINFAASIWVLHFCSLYACFLYNLSLPLCSLLSCCTPICCSLVPRSCLLFCVWLGRFLLGQALVYCTCTLLSVNIFFEAKFPVSVKIVRVYGKYKSQIYKWLHPCLVMHMARSSSYITGSYKQRSYLWD